MMDELLGAGHGLELGLDRERVIPLVVRVLPEPPRPLLVRPDVRVLGRKTPLQQPRPEPVKNWGCEGVRV